MGVAFMTEMSGAFMAQMGGAVVFWRDMLTKSTGLQRSTLSGHCMTMGFGPFELPTRGLLQKGQDKQAPLGYSVSRGESGEAKH